MKHQVRRMVGLLARIGEGLEPEEAIHQALSAGFDRRRASRAPAAGLWLEKVNFESMLGGIEYEDESPG